MHSDNKHFTVCFYNKGCTVIAYFEFTAINIHFYRTALANGSCA